MIKNVEITLAENSTAGNSPKIFKAQSVEIRHEQVTVSQSVDGPISTARHNSKVLWVEGKAKDLATATNVKIIGNNGEVLLNGELSRQFKAPRDTAKGVEFEVF